MYESIFISALLVAILVLLGLVPILFVLKKKEGKLEEANFQGYFILAIAWVAIGILYIAKNDLIAGIIFIILSICYIAVSLARKYKWIGK